MLNVGDNFLHYRIISRIGTGGMGEVFLAKDKQLERKVAIKLLRKKFGQNEDSLRRFILEAKSASALNHPNIITIYEIGESDGSNYIASEYIEGKTLHERLVGGSLPIDEILNIAIQTGEAITAAHAAGIVHRDIKPENVMIRHDGYVKVLDFGLAKLTERQVLSADFDADTHRMLDTNPGVVMGTVSYMSPEQARARDTDTRSDIWSLGVVIYEMVTGVLPFTGETTSDAIAAILKSTPAELFLYAPDVPKELERIVGKALRKNRDERYQHIKDMLIDLKDLRRELDLRSGSHNGFRRTGEPSRAESTDESVRQNSVTAFTGGATTHSISEMFLTQFRLHPTGMTAAIAVLVLALAAAVIALTIVIRSPGGQEPFQTMRLTKLTQSGNAESGQVAVSPDGKYVVYAVRDAGKQSLWVRHVATSGNVQILPPVDAAYRGLTFSHDGNYIYFARLEPAGSPSMYRVPVVGGETRKLVSDADGPISLSPDGSRFAFIRRDRELMIAKADGSGEQKVAAAPAGKAWWLPAWSPNGKSIVGRAFSAEDSSYRLFEVMVDNGAERLLGSQQWLRMTGLTWLPDGSGLLLSGRDPNTQLSQIWSMSYPDGKLTRVTNDLSSYQGLSITGDGNAVVSIQESRLSNIWIGDAPDAGDARKITSDVGKDDGLSGIALVPDGRVVYTTRTTGSQDLWIVDPDGRNNRQLTFDQGSHFHPAVSPDGKQIVFVSDRTGNINLWKMDLDGRNAVQLTDSSGIEGLPVFAPDGKWIIYHYGDDDRILTVWKISVDGGQPVQMTTARSGRPRVSPDGKLIAYAYGGSGSDPFTKIAVIPIDGGPPIRELDLPAVAAFQAYRWSADGRALIYAENRKGGFAVISQPLDGGPAKEISRVDGERLFSFTASQNGKTFAFARGSETSDAVMISGFR